MKNINVEVISKGRKYYKCKLNDKYDCKLISADELKIGEKYELLADDISVRSKFGTDLIYSCIQKVDKLINYNAVITLGTPASYCKAIFRLP